MEDLDRSLLTGRRPGKGCGESFVLERIIYLLLLIVIERIMHLLLLFSFVIERIIKGPSTKNMNLSYKFMKTQLQHKQNTK